MALKLKTGDRVPLPSQSETERINSRPVCVCRPALATGPLVCKKGQTFSRRETNDCIYNMAEWRYLLSRLI